MVKLKQLVVFFVVIGMLAIPIYVLADPPSNPVPDTGQTQSYTATFGEDSDYTINPHSYTDLGDMVKDNVTGLMWQQETAGQMTWEAAISYCEGLSLGGYSDWRLPTVKELSFIVDSGTYGPAINTSYFPNTMSSYYWSSTTRAFYTDYARYVFFDSGYVHISNKSHSYYVRAVRGGQ